MIVVFPAPLGPATTNKRGKRVRSLAPTASRPLISSPLRSCNNPSTRARRKFAKRLALRRPSPEADETDELGEETSAQKGIVTDEQLEFARPANSSSCECPPVHAASPPAVDTLFRRLRMLS